MNVFSRGVRNAFRNTVRSVSLITILGLSIGLCLSMLIAHQAVGAKINSVKGSVGNTISISPAGARGFEGGGEPLTQASLDKVKNLVHVTSIDESLSDRLNSSDTNLQSAVDAGSLGRRFNGGGNGGQMATPFSRGDDVQPGTSATFTPPVTVNGTTNPSQVSFGGFDNGSSFSLKSGKLFDNSSNDNVALLGSSLASKNNLKVGSTFTAYNTTLTVAGIFDAGNTFANNQIIMPLATVQKLSDQNGAVTSATVNVDSISNVNSVTSAIKKALGSNADVTNASERAQNSIQPLQNIQTISLYSLIGAVIAGAIIILLTMVMIVRERRREIGVIKAIGASNQNIVTLFTIEALTLTVLGSVVGILLGVLAANPITRMLVTNSTSSGGGPGMVRAGRGFGLVRNNLSAIHTNVGWSIILEGLAAAIVIGLIGSSLASFFIAKIRPAEVMRTE